MADRGFIKIHRKIKKWEWYGDHNTFRVFLHLLLSANHEAAKWRGIEVGRGQVVTSLAHLSSETSVSVRSVRTALNHLISTHELTCETTRDYTLVTILNWDTYQMDERDCDTPEDTPIDKRPTSNRHTTDKRPTTNKNDKNEKNEEKDKKDKALAPLDAALESFREMRKASKKRLTPKAEEMIRTKLEQLAPGNESKQVAILNQSTMNGWLGVFPLNEDKAATGRKSTNPAGNFTQREYSDKYLDSMYDEVPRLSPEELAAAMGQADEIPPPEED